MRAEFGVRGQAIQKKPSFDVSSSGVNEEKVDGISWPTIGRSICLLSESLQSSSEQPVQIDCDRQGHDRC